MNRELNNAIRWALENLLPPVVRDSPWFIHPLMRLYFGRDWRKYVRFKADTVRMSPDDIGRIYSEIKLPKSMQRPTDCNDACVRQILKDIAPFQSVLDAGCGRGYLAGEMAKVVPIVAGADIYVSANVKKAYPHIDFHEADIAHLPFADRSFDVVVATHTLEHVPNIHATINELRRVAKNVIIVVVPKERPYRSTLNLHLHFFPYMESLLLAINAGARDHTSFELGGDIYYRERVASPPPARNSI